MIEEQEDQQFLFELCEKLSIRRKVKLLETDQSIVPMTWGILKPVVVLPSQWRQWLTESRRLVLLHELAHVKRLDVVYQCVARLACALFWFHPLVWYALRLPVEQLLQIDDSTAFHPNMQAMFDLLQDNRLAVVQGVGYPNPNRSHDVSMAVWHTASPDQENHRGNGWLGKALDQLPVSHELPTSVLVANEAAPIALQGRKSLSVTMDSLKDFEAQFETRKLPPSEVESSVAGFMKRSSLDAYATAQRVSQIAASSGTQANESLSRLRSNLARRLKIIANLIQADFGPRVYYCTQSGYDTHAAQVPDHAELLGVLSSSLKAFLADMQTSGLGDQVLVLCFCEFGRQVKENASEGTDHGTAGPVFLAGNRVKAGIHGRPVDLQRLDDNAPEHTVDFRQVYATILQDWLSIAPASVLSHPPTRSYPSNGHLNDLAVFFCGV